MILLYIVRKFISFQHSLGIVQYISNFYLSTNIVVLNVFCIRAAASNNKYPIIRNACSIERKDQSNITICLLSIHAYIRARVPKDFPPKKPCSIKTTRSKYHPISLLSNTAFLWDCLSVCLSVLCFSRHIFNRRRRRTFLFFPSLWPFFTQLSGLEASQSFRILGRILHLAGPFSWSSEESLAKKSWSGGRRLPFSLESNLGNAGESGRYFHADQERRTDTELHPHLRKQLNRRGNGKSSLSIVIVDPTIPLLLLLKFSTRAHTQSYSMHACMHASLLVVI